MSSIALFYNTFTQEAELKSRLVTASGYSMYSDTDLIREAAVRFAEDKDKLERTIFGTKSVFNQFTLEKERSIARLKLILAEMIMRDEVLICGFSSLMVPSAVAHVLRVGVLDERSNRIQRAVSEGMSEKNAVKLIKKDDQIAEEFGKNYCGRSVTDPASFDLCLSSGKMEVIDMVQSILEQYRRPATMMTEESHAAAVDFLIASEAELALITKGYLVDVLCEHGCVTLKINQTTFNYAKLVDTLRGIVSGISGVKQVEVLASGSSAVSMIRDQDFTPPPKILLVDDEREFVQTLSERLITRNYGSYPVYSGEEAIDCLENEIPDVMVLDLKMPGMFGTEVLTKTKKIRPEVEIIILTGHGSEEDHKTCMELGAFAYLQKPVDIKELTDVIDSAYRKVAKTKLDRV